MYTFIAPFLGIFNKEEICNKSILYSVTLFFGVLGGGKGQLLDGWITCFTGILYILLDGWNRMFEGQTKLPNGC